jgi:NADPH:quinone reductase-like Zn-dependent oxidoreductase
MRALRFDRFGPPSVLHVVELSTPSPAPGEALIAVRAAGVNPSDVKNVEGRMAQTRPPRTPGRDFAGVVEAGPPDWRGVAVWGSGGDLGFVRDGTHAEAVVVPIAALARKPEPLSFAEAAAAGTPFVTAYLGWSRASVRAGDVVLVIGAAGSVGSAAVQLARWRGADVVGLVRTDEQSATARALGATRVVVHRDGDPRSAVDAAAALVGDRGIDIAFDTTGLALDTAVHLLAHGGRVVAISAPADGKTTFNLRELYRRDAELIGVDSLALTSADAAKILDELAPGFASGALQPPRVRERPLGDAVAAYEERAGKTVLVP